MDRYIKGLHNATLVIEGVVAVALVALAAGALFSLGYAIWHDAIKLTPITPAEFNEIIGRILEVFILIELFRITIAYMRHENVVPTVLEAALVAVARKFVVFDSSTNYFLTALGLSSLLIAVAVSWWLLSRSNACDIAEP